MKSKHHKTSHRPVMLAAAAFAFAASTQAADLTWNASFPGTWNTSNTNWSGSTWNNSTPDNAIFNNAGGTITLGENITAGSLGFYAGGAPSGGHELLLTGSTLSVGSIECWGGYYAPLGGGGVDNINQAYDQRLRFDSMTLNVSGSATVKRGMLYFNGATVNVGGTINGVDAWNVFRSDSSTVTATGGIDLSVIASQVELYGGTVTTPFIKVGNAAFNGTGGLTMGNGVTVVATQATSDFIQVYNNGNTSSRAAAGISSGGMTLDTSSYAVTVATVLTGSGSLTKTGSGTLTLSQSNSYTGATTVSQGMLVISAAAWSFGNVGGGGASAGAVTIGSGATLRADNSVANQLNGLTLNGGTLDAINTSGNSDWGNYYLTGNVTATGTSSMNADIALRTSNVDFNVTGSGDTLNVGGVLHNGAFFGIYSGAASTVSKSGSGSMVITGANTYSGATTVSQGTLLANNSTGSATGSGAVSVSSGATLGGTGTISGNTTVAGTLNAGNGGSSKETLAFGGTLDLSGTTTFDIGGSARGTSYDGIDITGALTNGGVLSLNFTDTFTAGSYTFDLFSFGSQSGSFSSVVLGGSYFGSLVNNGSGVWNYSSGGNSWTFTQSTGDLAFTAVPELSNVLIAGLLGVGLLRRRRNA